MIVPAQLKMDNLYIRIELEQSLANVNNYGEIMESISK